MNYRTEIDGLRAFSVLPVIFFHAGFEWFGGGFVGVDVFFVISGYLIATIIISEIEEGKFSLTNFYERRARRILPALFFVMLACIPFSWVWLTPSDLRDFGQSLVAVSTFSSNIFFWIKSGYFDVASELRPLLHTWSLAVEEQYYILFPLFLLLTWRLGIKWIVILLVLVLLTRIGVAHLAVTHGVHPKIISGAFYSLPTRGWELLLGMLFAIYFRYNGYIKSQLTNQICSLSGLGMIIFSIIAFDKDTPFPGMNALLPTIGAGLIILSATENTIARKLLSYSPVVGLGLVSYSAYLWHQPVLAFAKYGTLGEVPGFILVILCCLSLLLAYISWRWIEKPFRNKEVVGRNTVIYGSLSGVLLFSLTGLAVHSKGEIIFQYQPRIEFTFFRHFYSNERFEFMDAYRLNAGQKIQLQVNI